MCSAGPSGAILKAVDVAPERPRDLLDALRAGDRDLDGLGLDEVLEDLRPPPGRYEASAARPRLVAGAGASGSGGEMAWRSVAAGQLSRFG